MSVSKKRSPKKPKTAPKKMGRPSVFSEEIFDRILVGISNGKTLTSLCEAEDMPGLRTVYDWQEEDGKFIPSPARWLSDQRWHDHLTPGKRPKPSTPSGPSVDELEAFEWRSERYPESLEVHPRWQDFPFRKWPESTRREFLSERTQPAAAA
jgi:hypothetical protein